MSSTTMSAPQPVAGEFCERVVRVAPTHDHLTLLVAPDGRFFGLDGNGAPVLSDDADDGVMWRETPGHFRHAVSEADLDFARVSGGIQVRHAGPAKTDLMLTPAHGPERLPSAYLAEMRANGWTCLTSILSPDLVEALERVACTDRYAERKPDGSQPLLCQGPAIAQTAAEPVSLWVVRQYMQTPDIKIAHSPGMAVLTPDDGKRVVQGWHADYPYHWGVPAVGQVPTPSAQTVLGVQRNVCVSDFTKDGGATAFKLGSHALDQPPPESWGTATLHYQKGYRGEHGLPYSGPEADIVEAPGGSIILYDARTWHRAGINRSQKNRAALLQAMIPMYVMPKNDTSKPYLEFAASEAACELNERERREFQNLMVHQFIGPGGRYAIGADEALTALIS